jgi:hypothetical protein
MQALSRKIDRQTERARTLAPFDAQNEAAVGPIDGDSDTALMSLLAGAVGSAADIAAAVTPTTPNKYSPRPLAWLFVLAAPACPDVVGMARRSR